MTWLRSLLHARRWPAMAIIIAALAVRIAVPAGLMPSHDAHGATLILCSGHAMTMPGMVAADAGKASSGKSDPARTNAPCAFTGLIAAALDMTAVPVAPVPPRPFAAAPVAVTTSVAVRPLRLRPPSRGPPEPRAA